MKEQEDNDNKEIEKEIKIETETEQDKENKNKAEPEKTTMGLKALTLLIGIIIIIVTIIISYIVIRDKNNPALPYPSGSSGGMTVEKPIIYLYPTEEIDVTIKLGKPENLTHTYPKYEDVWNVMAKPNGDLIDLATGRNLYALYWEGKIENNSNMQEGFVIKGTDTISFLEEKLAILGLNEREANEFIVYWLPKLESNKYNYIRFQTMEEIEENMPLEITPSPDTTIRIIMEFKGLNDLIKVQEQKLETPERNGFVAVEWGGTEIL